MNRRALFKAIPAAIVASAAPAAALCVVDPAETPVMRLFREWQAADAAEAKVWAGGPDWDAPEVKAASERICGIMDRIHVTPAITPTDMLVKLCVMADFGQGEYLGADSDAIWDEALAMLEVAA